MLKFYKQNSLLINEATPYRLSSNGSLDKLQLVKYYELPAFLIPFAGVSIKSFQIIKLINSGDFAGGNTFINDTTTTLLTSYIEKKTINGVSSWICKSQNFDEFVSDGFYYLKIVDQIYNNELQLVDNYTYYSEPFEIFLPACNLLTASTVTNTKILYFDYLPNSSSPTGLRFHVQVANPYTFVKFYAIFGGVEYELTGTYNAVEQYPAINYIDVYVPNLSAILALNPTFKFNAWVNEICGTNNSADIAYVQLSQNIFNSLGVSTQTILNNTLWSLDALLWGGIGLLFEENGYIQLMDSTKIIDSSLISFKGTATILSVSNYRIIFSAGTVQDLVFYDTNGDKYEYFCCENEGDGNILHNYELTCNAQFQFAEWHENNEFFALLYFPFEILNNATNTRKIFIPKKKNGASNYLS